MDKVRTLATVFCFLPGAFAFPGTLRTSSPGVTSCLSLQFVSFLILREASSFSHEERVSVSRFLLNMHDLVCLGRALVSLV